MNKVDYEKEISNLNNDATRLNEIVKEKDKEIERLKRLVQKRYYTMKDKLEVVNIFDNIQRCEIEEREQEIERLNNIINELEKYFEFLKMNSTGGNKEFMEAILNYIKALRELEGSDKE
jgi:predicted RNase H-like nuclease (RuvC/YqgF family)